MKIEDFDLSLLAYNALKRHGINTVEQLCAISDDDLKYIRNLNARCIEEIKGKIEQYKSNQMNNVLKFKYKNWKGKISTRHIKVDSIKIYYGNVEWHDGDQWLMEAFDTDKNDIRHFAMRDILKFY